ncbi:alpha/beta hydrolase [Ochrobactrum sp. GPK 3]|uniref:alpha/beta fold hydrolase n=1 Tax=Brucella sp. 22210 TaxID=3453892 RepID=UPI0031384D05
MTNENRLSDWKTVPTQHVQVLGTRFAYCSLGSAKAIPSETGVPVVLLNHWAANLDNFDPRLVEGLSADRAVYALDYRGIGTSSGKVPLTIKEMSRDMIAVIRALGLGPVDMIGFSLGGFVSQQILFDGTELVRRVILAGTRPAGGTGIENVGIVSSPLILKGLVTLRDPKIFLFFTSSANGRLAANAFVARLNERKKNRDRSVGFGAMLRQLKAIKAWGLQPAQALETVQQPVLVANGNYDIMVPSQNSIDMAERIPHTKLVLYSDAGHGGIFQFHDTFLKEAKAFLAA